MQEINTNQQTSDIRYSTGQNASQLYIAIHWATVASSAHLSSKFIRKELSNMSIEEDARAFGQHFAGGWQLGLLVARNVQKRSHAGRPSKSEPVRNKVSCAKFAKMAGVSEHTTQWYWDTWTLAAEAGHCTPVDELLPGAEDPRLSDTDMDSYQFRKLWNKCYRKVRQRARSGNAESGTKRQRRKDSASQRQTDETSSAESESSHTDGNGDQTA